MLYPAQFTPAPEGGYVVTFRDIPEAITQGDTLDEATEMALDALITAIEFYFEDKRKVPEPSKPQAHERMVALPVSIWAKVLLLNELLNSQTSAAEVSRKLGMSPQNFNRVLNIKHPTKIDTINQVLDVFGKRLTVGIA